jgi:hypothetical protein
MSGKYICFSGCSLRLCLSSPYMEKVFAGVGEEILLKVVLFNDENYQ